jgi:hypothetical protein
MNPDDELERAIRRRLEDSAPRPGEAAARRLLAELERTPQRRNRGGFIAWPSAFWPRAMAFLAVVTAGFLIGALVARSDWLTAANRRSSTAPANSATDQRSPSVSDSSAPDVRVAGFTTPSPLSPESTWSRLTWRKLATTDTLGLVQKVVRWSGGYLAIGQVVRVGDHGRTPVWLSRDGKTWTALPQVVFGPSTVVMDIAEVPSGLVALTAQAGSDECPPGDCWTITGPLQSWTSADGARWVAHMGPELLPQGESVDRVGMVAGRAGIVAASTSLPVVASFSSDGVTWRPIQKGFPATFHLAGLWARVDGFAAVGAVYVDAGHQAGLALWSPDGESWSPAAGPLLTASSAITLASSGPSWDASGLVIGRDGGIAIGAEAGAPGGEFWWQSGDGQHWRLLNGFPPLGEWPPSGEGMLGQPNGSLASDGDRIVALRGGTQPRAWTSFDGLNWLTVAMSGEISMGQQPSQVTLFPGGVLVTEESGAWFGAAQDQ